MGWSERVELDGPTCQAPVEDFMSDSIKFGGVTLDCPNAGELAAFYAEITGGEVMVPGASWAMMTCPDGSAICFQGAPGLLTADLARRGLIVADAPGLRR